MKKTKLLALISVVLVLATVLCSCGGLKAAKPNKVLSGAYDNETKLLNNATQVDFGKAEIVTTYDKFVYLEDDSGENTKWIVYNLETGATVYTYTATETTSPRSAEFYTTNVPEVGLFTVTIRTKKDADTDATYVTELYDEKGNKIAGADVMSVTPTFGLDLFLFDGKCYRVAADKTITEMTAWNDLADPDILDDLREMTENYYYLKISDSSSGIKGIAVYGKDMTYVTTYLFPSYAIDRTYGVLADGKLFVQYSVRQPDDAKEYTYLNGDAEKYNLVTEIFNVKKEKSTSLKTDYKIAMIVSRDEGSVGDDAFVGLTDKIHAVAMAYEIKDGRVNENQASVKLISMTKNGKVQYSLSDMFPGMVAMLELVAENLFVYGTANGATYLANKDGKVLGDVSGCLGMNNKYLLGENKLYNYDLTVALDFKAEKLEYLMDSGNISYTNDGVFFVKENGSIWFYNGQMTEIVSETDLVWKTLTVRKAYFSVRKTESVTGFTYQYYSANGKQLLLTDYNVSQAAVYEGVFLFRGEKDGAPVYYRLAA